MRVAINLRLYAQGQIGGMENYVRHILSGISAHQRMIGDEWTVFALQSELENVSALAPGAKLISVTHETGEATIRSELEGGSYGLLFCPLLVLEPLRTGVPSAVSIPDLQHEFFPEYFTKEILAWRQHTFQPSVFHADVVFTISQHSKSTIVEKFGVDPEKVVVVGLDVDPEFRWPPSEEGDRAFRQLNVPENYLFYPANFWPHKNHSTVLRALKLLIDSGYPDLNLVFTGAPTTGISKVQAEVSRLKLARNVVFLGYRPRALIAELYRHSRALTFISRFEGFGIPILEAFHVGTPVVTASTTSCPEVADGAAVLVDESDPDDVAEGIRKVLEDDPLRKDLIERGKQRASQYSWKETTDITLQTFDRVVQARRSIRPIEIGEHPLVSVVTPTYNMGRFLEETIQSVLSQDYPSIEYIVMDGGSTDGTLDILRKYEGRLRFRSEPDGGQADAINRGFSLSSGQIFAFLNADDTYLPGAVSTAVKHMLANKSVGVVYGEGYHVREDGSIIGPYPTRAYDYELLSHNCIICQPTAFMWRDAFITAGWMNVDLQIALDYDLWIRIAKTRPLMKIDEFLATSRMYRENKTAGRRREVYQEIVRVVKAHYGFVPYDWVYGYAAYLVDRKDQIFEISHPSAFKHLFALFLGSILNPRQVLRYWTEWYVRSGLGEKFTGRWDDGWISRKYIYEFEGDTGLERIVISGRHLAPIRKGITLSASLNGAPLHKTTLHEHGPFSITLNLPHGAVGRSNRLTLYCDKTFRPTQNGDYRRLSCIVDSITVERAMSQKR